MSYDLDAEIEMARKRLHDYADRRAAHARILISLHARIETFKLTGRRPSILSALRSLPSLMVSVKPENRMQIPRHSDTLLHSRPSYNYFENHPLSCFDPLNYFIGVPLSKETVYDCPDESSASATVKLLKSRDNNSCLFETNVDVPFN